jgi:predicted RNA-binding protein (virulence factor B family)
LMFHYKFKDIKASNQCRYNSELRASRGFLRLTDSSHPEDIKTVLKMSKKHLRKRLVL